MAIVAINSIIIIIARGGENKQSARNIFVTEQQHCMHDRNDDGVFISFWLLR
jgi:hypothetical protein